MLLFFMTSMISSVRQAALGHCNFRNRNFFTLSHGAIYGIIATIKSNLNVRALFIVTILLLVVLRFGFWMHAMLMYICT